MSEVLVLVDHQDGVVRRPTFELLALARMLGSPAAVFLGTSYSPATCAALAEHGVPAITLCVAFEYPDYHAVGDQWQKIDYGNMARVDRMVALGLLHMANSTEPPHWVESNAKVKRYVEAQREAANPAAH